MKLRNKKTGKIVRVEFLNNWQTDDGTEIGFRVCNTTDVYSYTSLAELNAEWEDVPEEPKGYWFIDCAAPYPVDFCEFNEDTEDDKKIGNYFETKEEAEKAVEKLKSWKRLKDIGCSFDGWSVKTAGSEGDHLLINLYIKDCTECDELLDLLFGGEE